MPTDAAAAVCVQALGRTDLSDATHHALASAMMTLLLPDDARDASTALIHYAGASGAPPTPHPLPPPCI